MKTGTKVIVGFLAFFIVAQVSLRMFLAHEKSKYAKTAVPYIWKIVPEIVAGWDPHLAEGYFAPQVLSSTAVSDLNNDFKTYSQLGKLKMLGDPDLLEVTGGDGIGTRVTYAVPATFDAGSAKITIQVLEVGSGFQVYQFHIDSAAFK